MQNIRLAAVGLALAAALLITWASIQAGEEGTSLSTTTADTNYTEHAFTMSEKAELRQRLTPIQYTVACEGGTEPPFRNAYWDNKKPGIYVDIISGKPLFSSVDKFDSGTGWPSFTQALDAGEIVEKQDKSHGMVRTEVRSKTGQAHLGHVFPDGPAPTGLRFCINSASLRFIPAEDLEAEGYAEYAHLFETSD